MPTLLPNYLRSHRKRLDLSQDEVAFLLGGANGAKICRFENFVRKPDLETALGLEAIFREPASVLFGGLYADVEQRVALRAKELRSKLARSNSGNRRDNTRQALTRIINKGVLHA